MSASATILRIDNLKVSYKTLHGYKIAVNNITLKLTQGEFLGIIGESGCGKTTLINSILKLIPPDSIQLEGQITYEGQNIAGLSEREMQGIRWKEISLIPQNAMNSLNPLYRVGDQLVEAFLIHQNKSKKDAISKAVELFNLVGIEKNRLRDYPHQFSGGMKQRVLIAMSLVHQPSIILADEPTNSLDTMVGTKILAKFKGFLNTYNGSAIIVSHDISLITSYCNMAAVMYDGKIVEYGPAAEILNSPCHPYTMGLKNTSFLFQNKKQNIIPIPHGTSGLMESPQSCSFAKRCPFSVVKCFHEEPLLTQAGDSKIISACHRNDEAEDLRALAVLIETWNKGCC